MLEKQKMLKQQIEILNRTLRSAPEGSIHFYKSNGKIYCYWQIYDNGNRKRKYLGQNDSNLKYALVRKKINRALLTDYTAELTELENCANKLGFSRAEKVMKQEGVRAVIIECCEKWADEDYDTNDYFKDKCLHPGPNGKYVHSKSEANVFWELYDWYLPAQYERKLMLDDRKVFPDFTIKHPVTGQILLWEHFGMMDAPEYAQAAYEKISLYMKHGYFPGENLIVTFEDQTHPLTHQRIELEIQYHFGDWTSVNGRRS